MDDPATFQGFTAAAFDWLDAIAADNSRAGFEATRAVYEHDVRRPFAAMLTACAAETGGTPRVFRQLRDLRFARHREHPYWESIAGEIAPARPGPVLLVAQLAPVGLTAVCGARRPFTADQLRRYREAVADDATGEALASVVAGLIGHGAEIGGATLRTGPRGRPRDHPRAALLRHTSLTAGLTLEPRRRRRGRREISRDAALGHLTATWTRMRPLAAWLDAHVGPAEAAGRAAA